MRKKRIFFVLILMIFLAVPSVASGVKSASRRHFELSDDLTFTFTNADEVIETIHDGLASHAGSFTVSYTVGKSDFNEIKKLADELMYCAMYNTDSPVEGDYVRYQYGGYRLTYKEFGQGKYQLVITPTYYSTVEEEREVSDKVEEIMAELDISSKASEQEKVRAVYDYVCNYVKYDYVHVNSSLYHKDSTAYAALVKNYATCQGYAVGVFRLLKECGIECEVVTGTGIDEEGQSEFHAWNGVWLDGKYYILDATWDAGKEEYGYFLKSETEAAATHKAI